MIMMMMMFIILYSMCSCMHVCVYIIQVYRYILSSAMDGNVDNSNVIVVVVHCVLVWICTYISTIELNEWVSCNAVCFFFCCVAAASSSHSHSMADNAFVCVCVCVHSKLNISIPGFKYHLTGAPNTHSLIVHININNNTILILYIHILSYIACWHFFKTTNSILFIHMNIYGSEYIDEICMEEAQYSIYIHLYIEYQNSFERYCRNADENISMRM